jgi:hypothetical protein
MKLSSPGDETFIIIDIEEEHIMVKHKMLTPAEQIVVARELISKAGFAIINKSSRGSYYFSRVGQPVRKLRLATHVNYDCTNVVYDLVFEHNTIVNDVDYQVKKAIAQYDIKSKRAQIVY